MNEHNMFIWSSLYFYSKHLRFDYGYTNAKLFYTYNVSKDLVITKSHLVYYIRISLLVYNTECSCQLIKR